MPTPSDIRPMPVGDVYCTYFRYLLTYLRSRQMHLGVYTAFRESERHVERLYTPFVEMIIEQMRPRGASDWLCSPIFGRELQCERALG